MPVNVVSQLIMQIFDYLTQLSCSTLHLQYFTSYDLDLYDVGNNLTKNITVRSYRTEVIKCLSKFQI